MYRLKVFYKFQFLLFLQRQWLIEITSNKSIVGIFLNVKATDAKTVICNLCNNEFLKAGNDEKVFGFEFNVKAVYLTKKSGQFANGFDSFKYGVHIFQF